MLVQMNVNVLDICFMEEWTEPWKSYECIGCLSIWTLCLNGILGHPDSCLAALSNRFKITLSSVVNLPTPCQRLGQSRKPNNTSRYLQDMQLGCSPIPEKLKAQVLPVKHGLKAVITLKSFHNPCTQSAMETRRMKFKIPSGSPFKIHLMQSEESPLRHKLGPRIRELSWTDIFSLFQMLY